MPRPRLRPSRPPAPRSGGEPLEGYPGTEPATSDLVLLCCFGLDPAAERDAGQLRQALLAAGFNPRMAGQLIRTSPLLRRTPTGYLLRAFQG